MTDRQKQFIIIFLKSDASVCKQHVAVDNPVGREKQTSRSEVIIAYILYTVSKIHSLDLVILKRSQVKALEPENCLEFIRQ